MPLENNAPDTPPTARSGTWLATAGLVAGVLAIALAVWFWQRTDAVGREAGRRLQVSDQKVGELEAQLKQSQDAVRDLASRAAVLESKLGEAIGQQSQLEKMYRDMARDTLGAVLSDVENLVGIASQQLVVSGNVQGAIIALQDADARLKRVNQPDALGVRRLIARDLERLRAVPAVDVVALALRLDAVSSSLDTLPLLAGPVRGVAVQSARGEPQGSGFSLAGIASTGRRGWDALVSEFAQLFRVNRIDSPDAMLLAPEQSYFVRENLKLTLLSARISLLSRNETLFRADLDRAVRWIETYYDRQDRGAINALAALRQLRATRVLAELPSLGDTQAAVRAARAAREASR